MIRNIFTLLSSPPPSGTYVHLYLFLQLKSQSGQRLCEFCCIIYTTGHFSYLQNTPAGRTATYITSVYALTLVTTSATLPFQHVNLLPFIFVDQHMDDLCYSLRGVYIIIGKGGWKRYCLFALENTLKLEKSTTCPSFKTLWASLRKSTRFVPINERQNTATSTLAGFKGTYKLKKQKRKFKLRDDIRL